MSKGIVWMIRMQVSAISNEESQEARNLLFPPEIPSRFTESPSRFTESQPWGSSSYTILDGSHISFNTKRAKVDILTNPHFGRMVFLDGCIQCAESDETIYHAGVAAKAVENSPNNILLIGGGEGAMAREIFKAAPHLRRLTMVDWDQEFVTHMRTNENFSKGAFENPKLHIVYMDVMEYFQHTSQLFDSIIVDLVDAVSEDELKWLASVCRKSLNILYHGKVLVNAGGSYKNMMKLVEYIRSGKDNLTFDYSVFAVPSFQQPWYLMSIGKY